MENSKFDDFIKQSLEHLDGGKYIPMDWSSMNEQMNTDSLDDAMKGSLENLEGAAFVPMDWNMMESKLDAAMSDAEIDPQMEDIYLDAIAYDHLKNMQPAYNHEHWEMMSARLDEEYAYRRKVFVTKLFEVAIVLLLVWTAFNYFPNKKTPTPSSPFPIAVGTDTNSNQYNTNYLSTDLNEQSLLDNKSVVSFETTIPASIQDEGIKRIINEFPALVVETNPINQNAFTSIPTPPTSDNKITETPFSNNANSINLLNNKTQKATFLPLEKTFTLDEDEMLK